MGGGTVIVPSGNYLCTSILLKDNVNLILECGATIYASRNIDDYKNNTRMSGAADTDGVETLVLAKMPGMFLLQVVECCIVVPYVKDI